MSATGAFATIILERLLDMVTVLILLASYVFIFDRESEPDEPGGAQLVEMDRRDGRRRARWARS